MTTPYCVACGKTFTLSERIRNAYNDLDDNAFYAALKEVEELEHRVRSLEK